MSFIKIRDRNHLVRDTKTQAILNTDLSVVRKHEKRSIDLAKQLQMEQSINMLTAEMGEIKLLLKELLNKA